MSVMIYCIKFCPVLGKIPIFSRFFWQTSLFRRICIFVHFQFSMWRLFRQEGRTNIKISISYDVLPNWAIRQEGAASRHEYIRIEQQSQYDWGHTIVSQHNGWIHALWFQNSVYGKVFHPKSSEYNVKYLEKNFN